MSRRRVLATGAAVGIGTGLGALRSAPAMADAATTPRSNAAGEIRFDAGDVDVLDLTLHLIPELRICALAVKRARARGVPYPINDHEAIVSLLPRKVFYAAGHRISSNAIQTYVPASFFPIHTEAELQQRLYIALLRCKADTSLVSGGTGTPQELTAARLRLAVDKEAG
jgi:hypothetical protein